MFQNKNTSEDFEFPTCLDLFEYKHKKNTHSIVTQCGQMSMAFCFCIQIKAIKFIANKAQSQIIVAIVGHTRNQINQDHEILALSGKREGQMKDLS